MPSPKDVNHHPLITRFHPTSSLYDPHSVRWTIGLVKAGPYYLPSVREAIKKRKKEIRNCPKRRGSEVQPPFLIYQNSA